MGAATWYIREETLQAAQNRLDVLDSIGNNEMEKGDRVVPSEIEIRQ